MGALFTPFIGYAVDRVGKRNYFLLLSSSVMLLAHILFLTLPMCPQIGTCPNSYFTYLFIPLILLGLFYASYAAVLWPCIPLICDKNILGTGFGICDSI